MDPPLRIADGPYAGEMDADALGPRPPDGFAVVAADGVARYELDIDAAGLVYRFDGWRPETPEEVFADACFRHAERVRSESRALVAECRQLRRVGASERRGRSAGVAEIWQRIQTSLLAVRRSEIALAATDEAAAV